MPRRDTWIAAVAGRTEAQFIAVGVADTEPTQADAACDDPAFPVIDHPGVLTMPGTASAAEAARARLAHDQNLDRFFLETNVHRALKKMFVKIVPKPSHSDLVGGEDGDIDPEEIHDLLAHLDRKHNKMTPKERETLWATFNSPMGDLSPEECFTRQITCQKKLTSCPTPISDAKIKDMAIVHFNKVPHMQRHVEHWEDVEDPTNVATVGRFQNCFVKHAAPHHDNQAALREAGIVNQADAAAKSDLAQARAEVLHLQTQADNLSSDMSAIAGAVLTQQGSSDDSDSTATGSFLKRVAVPLQSNQVGQMTPDLQVLLNRIAQLEQNQNILRNGSNSTQKTRTTDNLARGKPIDLTGRKCGICCPNCGVQLTPGKCKDGCVRIERGHRGLPFPAQAEADKVTFENRNQFPKASKCHEDKWGKEWSQATEPRIVQQARS